MSVHHIFSQILKWNQSITISNLSCYQENELSIDKINLCTAEKTEAASEVAFRCIYTLFNAGHECI